MIGLVFRRDWREYIRTRRIRDMVVLAFVVLTTGLATGGALVAEHRRQTDLTRAADDSVVADQGRRSPHAAAHFGRLAIKPVPALAIFDPGASAYLGRVVWLEAHSRSPAMLRPAEDAPELSRLSELSAAGILAVFLPLLIFTVGAPSIAAERAQGTLRETLSTGLRFSEFFAGKLLAVTSVGALVSTTAIAGATIAAVGLFATPAQTLWRTSAILVGYTLYVVVFSAVAIAVSALSRTSALAQLTLLTVWAMTAVVLPKAAASVAERAYPTPDPGQFWARAAKAARGLRPALGSDGYRDAARDVMSRALGRPVSIAEAETIAVNKPALRLEISEVFGHRAFQEVYGELFDVYEQQRQVRRGFSALSPTIALKHFSATLSGTGILAHQRFCEAAERARRRVIERINQDMLLNGAGQGFSYVADEELWETLPAFVPPKASFAGDVRDGAWDLVILFVWACAAVGLAWVSVRRGLGGER